MVRSPCPEHSATGTAVLPVESIGRLNLFKNNTSTFSLETGLCFMRDPEGRQTATGMKRASYSSMTLAVSTLSWVCNWFESRCKAMTFHPSWKTTVKNTSAVVPVCWISCSSCRKLYLRLEIIRGSDNNNSNLYLYSIASQYSLSSPISEVSEELTNDWLILKKSHGEGRHNWNFENTKQPVNSKGSLVPTLTGSQRFGRSPRCEWRCANVILLLFL